MVESVSPKCIIQSEREEGQWKSFEQSRAMAAMDWFSWLSKTTLDPSLVYEYGLAFAHNELEEDDIVYFNHEFLQSMGISIAKHRLEILKLARKENALHPRPVTRLLLAIKRTKRCFSNLIRNFSHAHRRADDSKALVVVPKSTYAGKLLKRNKKLIIAKQQGSLLLTNGSSPAPAPPRADSFSGPIVYNLRREEEDGYWGNGVEEIRWDTMFQNLKPT